VYSPWLLVEGKGSVVVIANGYGWTGRGALCLYPLANVGQAVKLSVYSAWILVEGL